MDEKLRNNEPVAIIEMVGVVVGCIIGFILGIILIAIFGKWYFTAALFTNVADYIYFSYKRTKQTDNAKTEETENSEG